MDRWIDGWMGRYMDRRIDVWYEYIRYEYIDTQTDGQSGTTFVYVYINGGQQLQIGFHASLLFDSSQACLGDS